MVGFGCFGARTFSGVADSRKDFERFAFGPSEAQPFSCMLRQHQIRSNTAINRPSTIQII